MVRDSLLLKALRAENEGRAPVWLMRQAGRYMTSYQMIRKKYPLLEMFHEEDLITRITCLPIEELGVDAAILFSDILLPLEALGFSIAYDTGYGPQVFPKEFNIDTFPSLSLEELKEQFGFITNSIHNLKKRFCELPLIGFCGAPFTMASYILETKDHHLLRKTKQVLYQDARRFHQLLEKICDLVILYIKMQIDAGVDVIQIFDSWAGVLDEENFKMCSLYYLRKILDSLREEHIPMIVFCRGSSLFVEELISLKPAAISFDWHRPLHRLKEKTPFPIALQGNVDPDLLKAPLPIIRAKTEELLRSMADEKRFIVNLGHGVSPDIPEEGVRCFVESVKQFVR